MVVIIFFVLLLAMAWVDKKTMMIPDYFPAVIFLMSVRSPFLGKGAPLGMKVVGVLSVSLPMLILALIIPGAFGGGDIKLMAACGAFLGWERTILAMFFAILGGGGWGLWLLVRKQAGPKDHFPFGPFLCMGLMISTLWGENILRWYLSGFPGK